MREWMKCHKALAIAVAFVLAIVILVCIIVIPKQIKLNKKRELIDSRTVYYTKNGNRYHLYPECSNMVDAIETKEYEFPASNRKRCAKCYSGVMDYHAGDSSKWSPNLFQRTAMWLTDNVYVLAIIAAAIAFGVYYVMVDKKENVGCLLSGMCFCAIMLIVITIAGETEKEIKKRQIPKDTPIPIPSIVLPESSPVPTLHLDLPG